MSWTPATTVAIRVSSSNIWFCRVFSVGLNRLEFDLGVLGRFHTHLFCGPSSFVKDQAVEVVGEIGFGTDQPDGANVQAEAVFLMAKDVFDLSTNG